MIFGGAVSVNLSVCKQNVEPQDAASNLGTLGSSQGNRWGHAARAGGWELRPVANGRADFDRSLGFRSGTSPTYSGSCHQASEQVLHAFAGVGTTMQTSIHIFVAPQKSLPWPV